jgi:hypothetical protein
MATRLKQERNVATVAELRVLIGIRDNTWQSLFPATLTLSSLQNYIQNFRSSGHIKRNKASKDAEAYDLTPLGEQYLAQSIAFYQSLR